MIEVRSKVNNSSLPAQQGLYDPRNEHDACGVGFVAHIKGQASHDRVSQGLQILENLTHRGAVGADPLAGDGAGILVQVPDAFLRKVLTKAKVELPQAGDYGVGMLFLPRDAKARAACEKIIADRIKAEGQILLGWRDVPVENSGLGESVKAVEPVVRQVFIARGKKDSRSGRFRTQTVCHPQDCRTRDQRAAQRTGQGFLYSLNVVPHHRLQGHVAGRPSGEILSRSAGQSLVSAFSLVHQRFSTNTFPTWNLAHPFRMIAHNGEINTLRGNVNWMAARHAAMSSKFLGKDLDKLWPLIVENQSDSACFDNALELLVAGGYSLPHAMMLLIPEAWAGNPLMDEERARSTNTMLR